MNKVQKEKLKVILASYLFFNLLHKKQRKETENNTIKEIEKLFNNKD